MRNIYSLGIELGSTRIKAVLIDQNFEIVCQGNHEWSNQMIDGYWTYDLADVWKGIQASYAELAEEYKKRYGKSLRSVDSIGVSAMMHGYLAFNRNDELLVPFRTWRNTTTGEASKMLSELFQFSIPQRWSVAHYYQAILNGEEHTAQVKYLCTLASYVHWQISGEKVIGIGDAAGMFPISDQTRNYNQDFLSKFQALPNVSVDLSEVLPKVLVAGESAGVLTEEGALKIDPSGDLQAGALLCPPEGDAGTGMTATNSVAKRSGNVSAGTSIFAMLVLEKELEKFYEEIDLVTTPDGKPVAMVHCNNGTSEVDTWISIFHEFLQLIGSDLAKDKLYEYLYKSALKGQTDGIVAFNYLAGEPITDTEEGRPLYVRKPDKRMHLADFLLAQLFSTVATLRIGMDILEEEGVEVDEIIGHGGIFKTPVVMQRIMASALEIPVSVFQSASEGGAWGIALLAAYALDKRHKDLETYLAEEVFGSSEGSTKESPDPTLAKMFNEYMVDFKNVIAVEKAAIENY